MLKRERARLERLESFGSGLRPSRIELNGLSDKQIHQLFAMVPARVWV